MLRCLLRYPQILGWIVGGLLIGTWTSWCGAEPLTQEVRAGVVTLPRAFQLGKTVLSPGTYEVKLVPKAEGVFFQFYQKGELVAEDLAIEQPAVRSRRVPLLQGAKVPNQEFFRVLVEYGDSVYKLFLAPVSGG